MDFTYRRIRPGNSWLYADTMSCNKRLLCTACNGNILYLTCDDKAIDISRGGEAALKHSLNSCRPQVASANPKAGFMSTISHLCTPLAMFFSTMLHVCAWHIDVAVARTERCPSQARECHYNDDDDGMTPSQVQPRAGAGRRTPRSATDSLHPQPHPVATSAEPVLSRRQRPMNDG